MQHHKKTLRNLTQPNTFFQAIEQVVNLTSQELRTILAIGGAYLNGKRHKNAETTVQNGDLIELYYRQPLEQSTLQFQPGFIHFENKNILVANKPLGYPTQGRRDCDLVGFYECLRNKKQGYLGLHHRLDQDTSGLILFTRNRALNKTVAHLFQSQKIQKTYIAILQGNWVGKNKRHQVDAPIAPQKTKFGTQQVVRPHGKPAITEFELLAEQNQLCLVKVRPKTGRTHQIRVHAKHIGLPLVGDKLYGKPSDFGHFYLHAASLTWPQQKDLPQGDFQVAPQWSEFPEFMKIWSSHAP